MTELVPMEGEARELAAPLLALLRALLFMGPDESSAELTVPAKRPARSAVPAPAETAATGPARASAEPGIPGPSPGHDAASPAARADPPGSDEPAHPNRPTRVFGPLLLITEFFYTRRASRRLLHLYETVRREHPKHSATALYEEVVVRWSDVDVHAARAILRRAAQSFVDWDSDRDLRFRDVVIYLVADDYVRAHPERHGARSRMARTAARAIPKNF